MARRVYTDEDKARVIAALKINGGNVKRTSRDTQVPEQTVRDWAHDLRAHGVKQELVPLVDEATDVFIDKAVKLRDKAMDVLEGKIEKGEAKVGELNAVIGTLTDKINLAQGNPTSRSESISSGPDPEELGKAMMSFVKGAIEAANQRAIDVEIVEQEDRELTPGT